MTKKLIWRLREQPTAQSLQGLVDKSILTKDEAREILFSTETEEDRDKKSLESEIKFLRELVEKLSNDKNRIVEIIRETEKPIYIQQPWWNGYYTWCGGTQYYNATSNLVGGSINTSGTYSLNAMDCSSIPSREAFSDIKTF